MALQLKNNFNFIIFFSFLPHLSKPSCLLFIVLCILCGLCVRKTTILGGGFFVEDLFFFLVVLN